MKQSVIYIFFQLVFTCLLNAQAPLHVISSKDLAFLKGITKAVLDSSRIYPGDSASSSSGVNNTKGILIRPGGRDDYPAFWIRDYSMALETGFVGKAEQLHMLLLTAKTQCGQTWITKQGAMVPLGSIPDHIRMDNSLPIYFPGTYSYEEQGDTSYGMVPPYCDQFYFINMAHYYVKSTADKKILTTELEGINLIDRLELSFKTPPVRAENDLVYTTESFRGVDFGFRDAIKITGDLCFTSILKYHAAIQLAELFDILKNSNKSKQYRQIAAKIKKALPQAFLDKSGLLRASTGLSRQLDVWSTALAVYFDVLEGETKTIVCNALNEAYLKGTIAFKGNIRHVPIDNDYSETTAWEKTGVEKNSYQNGAYWGTPTGWVCYAISRVNRQSAARLAKEFITDLQENDFRKGENFGAPYECFYPPAYHQNSLYLATVACPYIVFKSSF